MSGQTYTTYTGCGDTITRVQAQAILDEVFPEPSRSKPGLCDDGTLTDGHASEPARLTSARAFRAQCRAWLRAISV